MWYLFSMTVTPQPRGLLRRLGAHLAPVAFVAALDPAREPDALGNLAPGATATVTISGTLAATAVGSVSNVASVVSPDDQDPADNTAEVTTPVTALAVLSSTSSGSTISTARRDGRPRAASNTKSFLPNNVTRSTHSSIPTGSSADTSPRETVSPRHCAPRRHRLRARHRAVLGSSAIPT